MNETHSREILENTKHTGQFSVFENYGVSHPDLSYVCVFGMYMTICGITYLYVYQLVIYITRDSMEGKMLLRARFMSDTQVRTILRARETW